ncbi:hypothetical protein [Mesorhizobium sp. NFR06]|uniref:hypothetical protein n=1 Tax=Mesorhizobium sp. NFR06 TaxID=1566290 RepID=UPI00122CBFC7|nr:hypothetical protein [Mesorhizobium sp. NFR06]
MPLLSGRLDGSVLELPPGEIARGEKVETGQPKPIGYVLGTLGRDFPIGEIAGHEGGFSTGGIVEAREAREDEGREEPAKPEHGKSLDRCYRATT